MHIVYLVPTRFVTVGVTDYAFAACVGHSHSAVLTTCSAQCCTIRHSRAEEALVASQHVAAVSHCSPEDAPQYVVPAVAACSREGHGNRPGGWGRIRMLFPMPLAQDLLMKSDHLRYPRLVILP